MSRAMYVRGISALLLLISGSVVQAEDGPVQTAAAPFLRMGVGARTLAMGGTGAAGREASWALFMNPAILGESRENRAAFSYHRLRFGVNQMALGGAIRLGARGGLGLGLNYVHVGDIEVRSGPTDMPEAIAEASDLAICGGYGREIIHGLHLGVGGKFFQEKLYEDKASSFVLDFGGRYEHERLDVGLAFRNVGGGIRFSEESSPPPIMGVLGIGVPLLEEQLRVAVDLEQPLVAGNRSKLRVGCEGRLLNLYLRTGYAYAFGAQQPDTWTGWTAGIGVVYDQKGTETSFQMDYGVSPSGVLGDIHQLSMAMRSGPLPLQIYVASPADGDTVYEAEAHLRGSMKGAEADTFSIVVNGQEILEDVSKIIWKRRFEEDISLKEGTNTIEFAAQTEKGTWVAKTIAVVHIPGDDPDIHIERPQDGEVVRTQDIQVSGYASHDKGIQQVDMLVNGKRCMSISGHGKKFFAFSRSVSLDRMMNQIQLVAHAVDGRTSTAACTVELEEVTLRRRNWALLIAIDTYQHLKALETPVSDADSLRMLLVRRYGFEPEHITALYNEQATRTAIIDTLTGFARRLGPEDNLLIYYAGHGRYDEALNMGYWIPVEGEYAVSGYLENTVLRGYIAPIKAQHILMVVDACYSGFLLAERDLEPSPMSDRYCHEVDKRRSRHVMTSGGQEPVWDSGYGNHSIFAYYFLQALRAYEDVHGCLTAGSLFDQIKIPVANNSRQTPILKALMDTGDEGGEFIFVLEETTR